VTVAHAVRGDSPVAHSVRPRRARPRALCVVLAPHIVACNSEAARCTRNALASIRLEGMTVCLHRHPLYDFKLVCAHVHAPTAYTSDTTYHEWSLKYTWNKSPHIAEHACMTGAQSRATHCRRRAARRRSHEAAQRRQCSHLSRGCGSRRRCSPCTPRCSQRAGGTRVDSNRAVCGGSGRRVRMVAHMHRICMEGIGGSNNRTITAMQCQVVCIGEDDDNRIHCLLQCYAASNFLFIEFEQKDMAW
jgi:hypothetical protein